MTELREEVRRRYAEAATGEGCGCGDGGCCGETAKFGEGLYSAEQRGELPDAAALASLGCGNPIAVADLKEGETVLDLGSGGGIDVILSAKRVGPTGLAFGLDMTDEMLALARRNAEEAGIRNAIFLKGIIEEVPLPAESVDVVISNCVINLSTDKPAVLAEMARVLKPGGRLGVSDVVAEDRLAPDQRAERGSYVGCIAGALSRGEYEEGLLAAGFENVSVTFTHEVTDGMHGAIVQAVKSPRLGAWHSARQEGSPGLDMTDEMLALAQRNADEAGIRNAIFLKGIIEEVPLPAESVDVVISNCVINLSTDKPAVLAELARVLRAGGRLGISDVVAEDRLSPEARAERGSYVGCIAGALSKSEYEDGLWAVGFEEVSVTFTHEVADGMHGAIVQATKGARPGARHSAWHEPQRETDLRHSTARLAARNPSDSDTRSAGLCCRASTV